MKERPEHDGVRSVAAYDDKSSLLPMRLKYGARLGLAELIGQHMVRFLHEVPADALIVPVPLHRWRLWSRGYNQSVLIGRALSKQSGLDMTSDILTRKNATPPLRSMSVKKRRTIVNRAFWISPKMVGSIAGKTIILVDDVYTTGSTANACAKLLKKSGAAKVLVFCWARVLTDYDKA
ncbi:ComF family protein [Parasphingorhabdus cellanae]|uniref:ComF family protein n=1 Tax=Parasphingorhabdus cellanae TaxID=2806553 RepID=UPI001FB108B1|nr:ComF family protein [Parasphingorhabdus cellanae]